MQCKHVIRFLNKWELFFNLLVFLMSFYAMVCALYCYFKTSACVCSYHTRLHLHPLPLSSCHAEIGMSSYLEGCCLPDIARRMLAIRYLQARKALMHSSNSEQLPLGERIHYIPLPSLQHRTPSIWHHFWVWLVDPIRDQTRTLIIFPSEKLLVLKGWTWTEIIYCKKGICIQPICCRGITSSFIFPILSWASENALSWRRSPGEEWSVLASE